MDTTKKQRKKRYKIRYKQRRKAKKQVKKKRMLDFKKGLELSATGAAVGGTVGTVSFPVIGTVGGAAVGAVGGFIAGAFDFGGAAGNRNDGKTKYIEFWSHFPGEKNFGKKAVRLNTNPKWYETEFMRDYHAAGFSSMNEQMTAFEWATENRQDLFTNSELNSNWSKFWPALAIAWKSSKPKNAPAVMPTVGNTGVSIGGSNSFVSGIDFNDILNGAITGAKDGAVGAIGKQPPVREAVIRATDNSIGNFFKENWLIATILTVVTFGGILLFKNKNSRR